MLFQRIVPALSFGTRWPPTCYDDRETVMPILAVWYHHSPEGQQFLQGRDPRVMLVAAGILAAYVLLRTRQRFLHRESRWLTVGRLLAGGTVATALWMGVDWVRGEDWILQFLAALPELHENAIRYSLLIAAGWVGWSMAVFEVLRRIAIPPHNGA